MKTVNEEPARSVLAAADVPAVDAQQLVEQQQQPEAYAASDLEEEQLLWLGRS